ncbi:MAG: hypothetical protein COV46_08800 [Deltaproteobacteria bacterium CG11_big_fil_rev_8_21_14_0_20_49_13]|nr:MAG: hypothetical protein COV46_08800 [Deltaproteobacteria bacterium CG11_big_fil_rev_8_21_14_0_20_49_13]
MKTTEVGIRKQETGKTMLHFIMLLASWLMFFSSCAGDEIFKEIGNNIASPLSINIDSATKRLYLVNSNNTVLYKNGSLQVYDLADPLIPALVGTAPTTSFSGHTYYDPATNVIFVANRYSSNNADLVDNIIRVNVDEASADFLKVEYFEDGSNPFGIERDTSNTNVYVAAYNSTIDYFPVADPASMTPISVANLALSDGTTLGGADMRDLTIIGRQAFITIPTGGMFVLDLDENNIDYYVSDFLSPRAATNDETYVYMTDVEYIDDQYTPLLYVLDPAAFPPITGNTTATVMSKDDAGVVVTSIGVGADSNADPQEMVIATDYIFVTNTGDNSVSVIGIPGYVRGADITVGSQPFGMGLYSPPPAGVDAYLYVGNIDDNTISIIDMATLTVVATIP